MSFVYGELEVFVGEVCVMMRCGREGEKKELADMYKSRDNWHDSGIVGGNQWTIGSLKDACDNRNCYCEILHDRA